MPLASGSRLGPYEILAAIGAGGMGEVYRARDTRLDRTVAIKILAADVAADPEFRERFEREAKTISSLDHPHICTLFDVGHDAGTGVDYLVMQYLDGETLADRLSRASQPKSDAGARPPSSGGTAVSTSRGGPIPLDQTLRYAAEIADALDAAHRRGIVHRDLKPGNVMITKSGVQLLDFGLAKLREQQAPAVGGFTIAATRSTPLTGQGALLGTLQYMSPEQLHGGDVDARSDIFAFGAILFEMLTGQRAFESKSQAGVIAAILDADPPPLAQLADARTLLPGAAQRSLDRVLRKCLAKNPDERWQSAADLGDELKWIDQERLRGAGQEAAGTVAATVSGSRTRERWWIGATVAATLVAIGLGAWTVLPPGPPAEQTRFVVLPPDGQVFASGPGLLSVSPDGRRLAFVTGPSPEKYMLYVRPLGALTAQLLPGSETAWQPFWSPDGRYVAFIAGAAGGKLKRIDVSGGPPLTLADFTTSRGAWSSQGVILFQGRDRRLYRIPESGGQPTPVTELDTSRQEATHEWPVFLPDGRRFIFLAQSNDSSKSALFLASLDSPARTRLVDGLSSVEYAGGYLLFQREGTLMAQPFDEKKGRMAGDAGPLVEGVNRNPQNGRAAFSVSATGVLVYRTGASAGTSALNWYDRAGKLVGKVGELSSYQNPRLSPDGHRLIVARRDEQPTWDLWLIDLDRNLPSRFTFDQADDISPVWSPDGARIVFASNRKNAYDLYQRASGGAASDERLYESPENKIPTGFSPDGNILLFNRSMGPGRGIDIWALPMSGDRKPFPVIATAFNEGYAVFSPDGRWIAYDSNDSGPTQVYVQPFPPTGAKVQLSTTSGYSPAWSADGKRVFFSTSDKHLIEVDVATSGTELRAGVPRDLFAFRQSGSPRNFTVEPSGQRFLIAVTADEQTEAPITVVLNWQAGLKK